MKTYSDGEKIQIMLESDLLNDTLNREELSEIKELAKLDYELIDSKFIENSNLSGNLKKKVLNRLRQGLKFGLELEKIGQKGIRIITTPKKEVPRAILEKFEFEPSLLFVVGNISEIDQNNVPAILQYNELTRVKEQNLVFIADRNFSSLLADKEISQRLIDNKLILISENYHSKSLLKNGNKADLMIKKSFGTKKVFISGSRSQEEIPGNVQESLKLIKNQNIEILIGDSEKGVDNQIIDYLRLSPLYKSVKVFSIKEKARVKIEQDWDFQIIKSNPALNPQERQMVKDRAMADIADYGLAIFKPVSLNRYRAIQVSSGTLRNVIQMLLNHKMVKLFYMFENDFCFENLKSIDDLKDVIEKYRNEKLSKDEKKLILSAKGININSNLTLEKYNRINKKFEQLVKNEQSQMKYIISNPEDEQFIQTNLFNK